MNKEVLRQMLDDLLTAIEELNVTVENIEEELARTPAEVAVVDFEVIGLGEHKTPRE